MGISQTNCKYANLVSFTFTVCWLIQQDNNTWTSVIPQALLAGEYVSGSIELTSAINNDLGHV